MRFLVADASEQGEISTVTTDSLELPLLSLLGEKSEETARQVGALASYLHSCREIAEAAGASQIIAFGTEATRQLVRNDLENLGSLDIRIIDERTEAYFSLVAAVKGMPNLENSGNTVAVVDQGAGSLEVAVGKSAPEIQLDAFATLPLGSDRLVEKFRVCDYDIARYSSGIHQDLVGIPKTDVPGRVVTFGSVATKVAWLGKKPNTTDSYAPHIVHGTTLSLAFLENMLDRIGNLTPKQFSMVAKQIEPGRSDDDELRRLVCGAVVLVQLIRKFQSDELLVSAFGTRHGVAWALAKDRLNPFVATVRHQQAQ